jgi:hypothetical protein
VVLAGFISGFDEDKAAWEVQVRNFPAIQLSYSVKCSLYVPIPGHFGFPFKRGQSYKQ